MSLSKQPFSVLLGICLAIIAIVTSGCRRPDPYAADRQKALDAGMNANSAHFEAMTPYRNWVEHNFPASDYTSNDYVLTTLEAIETPEWNREKELTIAVSGPTNELHGPWLVAMARGYFEAVGIRINWHRLERGSDPYDLLRHQEIDVYLEPFGSVLIQRAAERAESPFLGISRIYQKSPYGFFTLDYNIPQTETSNAVLWPSIFEGRIVEMPNSQGYLIGLISDRYSVPKIKMKIVGSNMDPNRHLRNISNYGLVEIGTLTRVMQQREIRNYVSANLEDTLTPQAAWISVIYHPEASNDSSWQSRYNWALLKGTLDLIQDTEGAARDLRRRAQQKHPLSQIIAAWTERAPYVRGYRLKPLLSIDEDFMNWDAAALLKHGYLGEKSDAARKSIRGD